MCILPLNGATEFLNQTVRLRVILGTEALLNPQGLTQVEIHLKINFAHLYTNQEYTWSPPLQPYSSEGRPLPLCEIITLHKCIDYHPLQQSTS